VKTIVFVTVELLILSVMMILLAMIIVQEIKKHETVLLTILSLIEYVSVEIINNTDD
jgi:hypothetical protein